MTPDPFDLGRFVAAQEREYPQVCAELAAGRKRTHWMWFIFPQLAGLGSSPMARRYALGGTSEARAYLGHGVLGPRLRECTSLVNGVRGCTALQIFGAPDDVKFRSCMTLFALAAGGESAFHEALARYFDGEPDPLTLRLLRSE
ncbi:MAG: DUF1810 domain-containing protein [Steroidobacteraceae bacterium]